MESLTLEKTVAPQTAASLAAGRQWADFLVSEGLICERDCCGHAYGRTVLMGARYFSHLEDKGRVANTLSNLISGGKEGFVTFLSWDGPVSIRYRSKTGRKGAVRLKGEELIARSRTSTGR